MGSYLLVFTAALLATAALTPLVRRGALASGAVDLPGARKLHLQPVPRWGGIAVVAAAAGVVAGALALNPTLAPAVAGTLGAARWAALGIAVAAIFVLGSLDDLRAVRAEVKFVIETAAAAVVVTAAVPLRALDLSPLAGTIELGPAGPVLAVLWIVALTNAVNMSDGMDGVAAGLGAVGAATLGLMSLVLDNTVAATVLLATAGGLLGFLPFNLLRPKTFLGDSGSLSVGFVLGAASLVGLEAPGGGWLVFPALLALALPLAECTLTVLRRTLAALQVVHLPDEPSQRFELRPRHPHLFLADRRHIHHRLLDLGMSPDWALALLYVLAGVLAILGMVAVRWPLAGPFAGLLALALAAYFVPRWLYEELRVLERGALLPLFDSRWVKRRALHGAYDGSAAALSYLAATALVSGPGALLAGETLARAALVAAAALLGFKLGGLYRLAFRHAGIWEMLRVVRAVLVGVAFAAAAHVLAFGGLSPATLALFLFLALTAVMATRLSFRILNHVYQRSRDGGRRALIFGAGQGGALALQEMLSDPRLGLAPVGFLDDDPDRQGRDLHGFHIHPADDLVALLAKLEIADVVVATRKVSEARYAALADACDETGVRMLGFEMSWEEKNGRRRGVGIVDRERVEARVGAAGQ